MDVIHTVAELRARLAGETSVALVPTMGNLHGGHLSLVDLAHRHGRCVVASIFVNRLQFEPESDFERYPRTLPRDAGLLDAARCHVVFAPDEREMYPVAQEILVTPSRLASELDGAFRPGHFQGVATIVSKLFNIVAPSAAVFGKKDYQQLRVIRELVKQLNFGIEIVGAETVREADGLAMSSRNGYLSRSERAEAPRLQRSLAGIKAAIESGARDFAGLERAATEELVARGWRVDYVSVRDREHLALPGPSPGAGALVVLAAAWVGKTRLIDNLEIR